MDLTDHVAPTPPLPTASLTLNLLAPTTVDARINP